MKCLVEVYKEGDAHGKTFFFPKPLFHITEDTFKEEDWEEYLDLISELSSEQGISYFVFDRNGDTTVSQCCRLRLKLRKEDIQKAKRSETLRFTALQNVTLNLPRVGYKAKGDEEKLYRELDRVFNLAIKAHREKRDFIQGLLEEGERGVLSFFSQKKDGEPYMRIEECKYLVGILGLNELSKAHLGVPLHHPKGMALGLKILSYLKKNVKKWKI